MKKLNSEDNMSVGWLVLGLLIAISGIISFLPIHVLTIEVLGPFAMLMFIYGLMAMAAGGTLILSCFVTLEHGSSIVH